MLLGSGSAVGALPTLADLVRDGRLLWFNAEQFRVPADSRTHFDLPTYVGDSLVRLVDKWPAMESALPFGLALALVAVPLLLLGRGAA